ncbi:MAG: ATP-binding protein, partial [Alcanivoracaceae bacterium]|nr:ATP-binding protein [Alcanivoracaceae bacterium]
LFDTTPSECSDTVRARVAATRERQLARQGKLNNLLDAEELKPMIALHQDWLTQVMERLGISARALHRLTRVARTIADMAGCDDLETIHLQEAISFRIQH